MTIASNQIAWFVHIAARGDGGVVGEELQRKRSGDADDQPGPDPLYTFTTALAGGGRWMSPGVAGSDSASLPADVGHDIPSPC
ncbi:hypothetical protein [Acrocarpospora sp. B8E8]|uniref:hypothetical protein n=1 Tax=Acrocarpospora sp. B8E8 TaxID=3153572 RepID=UPI00325E55C8